MANTICAIPESSDQLPVYGNRLYNTIVPRAARNA